MDIWPSQISQILLPEVCSYSMLNDGHNTTVHCSRKNKDGRLLTWSFERTLEHMDIPDKKDEERATAVSIEKSLLSEQKTMTCWEF